VRDKILEKLQGIQSEHDVKIVYACEAGSRAWGFESSDSDYDVRFIYIRPTDWYLTINTETRADTIEKGIDENDIDASGWDLRKALGLFRKSNPPLLEWLNSPIVYVERGLTARMMRDLIPSCYSPCSAAHHYLSMARGNYREYLRGDEVWLKKYLYVIRPLLAVRWIRMQLGVAPVAFQTLVDGVVPEADVKEAISELLVAKMSGVELGMGPKNERLENFLKNELSIYENNDVLVDLQKGKSDVNVLNSLFRQMLKEIS